mgnify:CR=1 FL=1
MRRVLFIGQAMPRAKRDIHDWPSLNNWLYSIGITHDQIVKNFLYSALVDYFPGSKKGSHLVPTPSEIAKDKPRLVKTIRDFNPYIVVPIGKLSISHCLNQDFDLLTDILGKVYEVDPYQALGRSILVIPLPHPSGASTWHHHPTHKKLLLQSLNLLRHHLS